MSWRLPPLLSDLWKEKLTNKNKINAKKQTKYGSKLQTWQLQHTATAIQQKKKADSKKFSSAKVCHFTFVIYFVALWGLLWNVAKFDCFGTLVLKNVCFVCVCEPPLPLLRESRTLVLHCVFGFLCSFLLSHNTRVFCDFIHLLLRLISYHSRRLALLENRFYKNW